MIEDDKNNDIEKLKTQEIQNFFFTTYELSQYEVYILANDKWLNDNCINFYLDFIKYSTETKISIFNTFTFKLFQRDVAKPCRKSLWENFLQFKKKAKNITFWIKIH